MRNSEKLKAILEEFGNENNFIFTPQSFYSAFPDLTEANVNQLLCRADKSGLLERVCKGVYVYTKVKYDPSSVLFLCARTLRYSEFMYVSLETVLSSLSVISQQMLSYITIITSGRSGIINCSRFGKIEFVHSDKTDMDTENLGYDTKTGLFWANKELALKDMKMHRRKLISLIEENNDDI